MKMAARVYDDYPSDNRELIESGRVQDNICVNVDANGLLKVHTQNGKQRYLKLGNVHCEDVFTNTKLTDDNYVAVLDTLTGKIMLFDIMKIYNHQLVYGDNDILMDDGSQYRISQQTSDLVAQIMIKKKKVHTSVDFT